MERLTALRERCLQESYDYHRAMLDGIEDYYATLKEESEEVGEDMERWRWVSTYETIALACANTGLPFMAEDVYFATVAKLETGPPPDTEKILPHVIRRLRRKGVIEPFENMKALSHKAGNHVYVWSGTAPHAVNSNDYWAGELKKLQDKRKRRKRQASSA